MIPATNPDETSVATLHSTFCSLLLFHATAQRNATNTKTSFAIFAPSRDVFQQLSILQIIKLSA
jgi:hypothetical protein